MHIWHSSKFNIVEKFNVKCYVFQPKKGTLQGPGLLLLLSLDFFFSSKMIIDYYSITCDQLALLVSSFD